MVIKKFSRTDYPPHTCHIQACSYMRAHTDEHTRTTFLEIISGLLSLYMQSMQEGLLPSTPVFTLCSLSPFKPGEMLSKLKKKILLAHGNTIVCLRQKKKHGETAKHNTNFRRGEQQNCGTQTYLALSPLSHRTVNRSLHGTSLPSVGCLVLLVSRPASTPPPGGLSCCCNARLLNVCERSFHDIFRNLQNSV